MQSTKQPLVIHRKQMEKIKLRIKALKQKQQKGQSMEEVLTEEIMTDSFPPSPVPNI